MTDFDRSFWKIIDRKSYGENGPSFFINSDQGTLTFENDDSVVYRPSRGREVRLGRLPGATVIHLCEYRTRAYLLFGGRSSEVPPSALA